MLPKDIFEQHTHIGLDLDETLASTVQGVLDYAHRQGALVSCPTFEDVSAYDMTRLDPNLSVDAASALWEGYGKSTMDPLLVPVIPGSKKGVESLLTLSKQISIVTARSDRESWKVERTGDWVNEHFPEIGTSHIAFVNHFYVDARPKSYVCKELGVTLMIDDSIENAYDLAEAGIATILLEKPWNQDIPFDHHLVYRVRDWQEIQEALNFSLGVQR